MDQLYSRTEMPDGNRVPGAVPEPAPDAGTEAGSIMSALPRRRVYRRSELRAPVVEGAVAIAAVPEEHPRLQPVAGSVPVPTSTRGPRRRSRRTLPPPREPAPGIGRLAVDGVVAAGKLPWRVAAEVARQAAGALQR